MICTICKRIDIRHRTFAARHRRRVTRLQRAGQCVAAGVRDCRKRDTCAGHIGSLNVSGTIHRSAACARRNGEVRYVQRDRLIHRAAVAARVGHCVRSGECLRAVAAQRAVAARHRQGAVGRAVVGDGQALARQVGDGVRCSGGVRIHAARHRLARHRAADRRGGQILHQEALRRLL